MKIKMNITNMNSFVKAINQCDGPVFWIHESGQKMQIDKNSIATLWSDFQTKKHYLSIWLAYQVPTDYFRLLSCTAWDY